MHVRNVLVTTEMLEIKIDTRRTADFQRTIISLHMKTAIIVTAVLETLMNT